MPNLTKKPGYGKFDNIDLNIQRIAKSAIGGIDSLGYTDATREGNANQCTLMDCSADEVAFIDRIVIYGHTGDGVANTKVTMKINDQVCPLNFPSADDTARSIQLDLKPNGNLVINPGKKLQFTADTATWADVEVEYRKYTVAEAYQQGLLNGGTLPTVASTNSVTGSGTSSGTAKKIIDCPAGYQIRILGWYHTGHSFNTNSDYSVLGFWNAVGTFFTAPATKATTAHLVSVGWARGANEAFAPKIIVDDTEGCIEGPEGYHLYIQQSAVGTPGIAAATPNADYVVMYQLVKATHQMQESTLTTALSGGTETSVVIADAIFPDVPVRGVGLVTVVADDGTKMSCDVTSWTSKTFTIASKDFGTHSASVGARVFFNRLLNTVNDPTGSLAQTMTRRGRWWASTITAATTSPSVTMNPVFETYSVNKSDSLIKVKGYTSSYVVTRGAALPALAGLVRGADVTAAIPVLGFVHMFDSSYADVPSPATTSRSITTTARNMMTTWSDIPSFVAWQDQASTVVARFQCAWGTMSSYKDAKNFSNQLA